MNRIHKLCAALILSAVTGCQFDAGYTKDAPTIPSYPPLAGSFDTSARVATCGVSAIPRNRLATALQAAGYGAGGGATDGSSVTLVKPDLMADVLWVECDQHITQGGGRYNIHHTCHMAVRVRKPMTAECGKAPCVDRGQTFEVWSMTSGAKYVGYKIENNQIVMRDGKRVLDFPEDVERGLVDKACANLLNIEGFRRALERK